MLKINKILKISLMKKEISDNEKNFFEMKLINKIKNIVYTIFESQNVLIIIKIKYNEACICETKYD